MGEEREVSRSLSLWDRTGKNASGKGHEPEAALAGKSEGARAPGAVLAARGTGHLQGAQAISRTISCPRLWPLDIALAIRQSDLILVPLLRPDWNSDVLPKPTPCLPPSALPVLLLLPENSSNPDPQLHIFKFYPYFKKSHFLWILLYPLSRNGNFGFFV